MWQTLILAAIFLLISFAFLAIKILVLKRGSFPKIHVSQNAALQKKGIHCVQTQDWEDRNRKGLYEDDKKQSKI